MSEGRVLKQMAATILLGGAIASGIEASDSGSLWAVGHMYFFLWVAAGLAR